MLFIREASVPAKMFHFQKKKKGLFSLLLKEAVLTVTLCWTHKLARRHAHTHAHTHMHKYSWKDAPDAAPIRFCHMEAIECEIENRDGNTTVMSEF